MEPNQLNEKIAGIAAEFSLLQTEVAKFASGNNAAGVRARNTLQKVKISCAEIRAEILDITKARAQGVTAPVSAPVATTVKPPTKGPDATVFPKGETAKVVENPPAKA